MNVTDFLEPRFLLDAAQTVVIGLLWLRKPGQDAGLAVEHVKGRVDVLEERIKHMPTTDELTQLEGTVKAIEAKLDGMVESQTTVRNVVGRFSLDQLLANTAAINEQIKDVIDKHTEPWGTQVTVVEIKDITLPDNMQRAMAKEAEAERERRAKIVAAEGEYQAAVKLGQAADIITAHPVALQLRTLQTMAEIAVEKNSTIIFPAQFMLTVQDALATLGKDAKGT